MNEETQSRFFLPLLLLAVVIWFAFQASQLYQERGNLAGLRSSQEATYQNAQKMRGQLDSLAAGTQKLANTGNRNAKVVVNALQQRGITPSSPTPRKRNKPKAAPPLDQAGE